MDQFQELRNARSPPTGCYGSREASSPRARDHLHARRTCAKRLKKSRSKLYMEAVVEYVARHEPEAITDALNQLARKLDTRLDEATSAATTRMLESSEW